MNLTDWNIRSSIGAAVALFVIAFFAVGPSVASEEVGYKKYKDSGDSFIRITSVFGGGKSSGYAPFHIVIRNNTDKDRTWNVQLSNNGSWGSLNYTKAVRYEVPAGAELRTDLFVPIPPLLKSSSFYHNWSILATASGLDALTSFQSSQVESRWPSIAISESLARRSLSSLDAKKKDLKFGEQPFAHIYDHKLLPREWIGYTCLDALMVDENTWSMLETSQRQAIVEWIRIGGQLNFYSKNDDFDLKHPTLQRAIQDGEDRKQIGMGSLQLLRWNGNQLSESLVTKVRSSIPIRNEYISSQFGSRWPLMRQFGKKQFDILLVFIILFTFAVVIGPVNLFWLAKPGRRHRLFITTPLISLAAVILMSIIIFFQDGLGGEGARIAVAELQANSDEMRLYLSQEQYSRTGVIVRTGFLADEEMEISPVKLPDSPWNPLSSRNGILGQMKFSGNQYSGDFFTSRSEQGYAIRTVRPTRARIEVRAPGNGEDPPDLFSSLSFSISDFIYRTREGTTYRSPEGVRIDPGNPIPLEPMTETAYIEWIDSHSTDLSKFLSENIRTYRLNPDHFFANVIQAGDLLVKTHTGIEWENDRVLLTGNLNPPISPGAALPEKSETPTGEEDDKP